MAKQKYWIFFGIMTANASIITSRREKKTALKNTITNGRQAA